MKADLLRIEMVADIHTDYPYLEVFYMEMQQPFLEVGITNEKELNFKFYPNSQEVDLSLNDMDNITNQAKEFLLESLRNEEYFSKLCDEKLE